jgi:hypothetical protein
MMLVAIYSVISEEIVSIIGKALIVPPNKIALNLPHLSNNAE